MTNGIFNTKTLGVILASNYSVVGLVIGGKDLGEVIQRVKGKQFKSNNSTNFAFTLDELIRIKYENKEMSFDTGRLVKKPGFKIGNCNLFIRENGKNIPIPDKEIKLTARFVESNKTVGFKAVFRGKEMNLSVPNLVALCSIFKPVDFTVAVRDSKVLRKDPATGKEVEAIVKKPYLVGTNGNKLSELPTEVIKTRKKDGLAKGDDNRSVIVLDPKTVSVKKLIEEIRILGGLIVLKNNSNEGEAGYEADNKSDGFVSSGFDIATPELIFEDGSLDVKLEVKRIGRLNSKGGDTTPVYKLVERYLVKDFRTATPKLMVALYKNDSRRLLDELGVKSNTYNGITLNSSETKLLNELEQLKAIPRYGILYDKGGDIIKSTYSLVGLSEVIEFDISKLLFTREKSTDLFDNLKDLSKCALGASEGRVSYRLMIDALKLKGIVPRNKMSESNELKNSWKSLGNRELNTELGQLGKAIRLPKRVGKIGVRYIINGEDKIKGIQPFISDESIKNIKALIASRNGNSIYTILQSVGFAIDNELGAVSKALKNKDSSSVNRVLTAGMSDEAVALAHKYILGSVLCLCALDKKDLDSYNYGLYCKIVSTKYSYNYMTGQLVEYAHSRLIENRFKNFGKYNNDIDKSWKAFKKSDKYNIYQNKDVSGLYLQLTGVTFKATQSTVDKKDNEGKVEAKKSIIDTHEKIFNYSGNLALYDFMKTLQDAKCAIVKVDETEKLLKNGIPSFCGIEVALPSLICRDSYNLMLDYKRIGIVKTHSKNYIVYRDIYRYITKDFKTEEVFTVVCSKESLQALGGIIGNDTDCVMPLDPRVGGVIKSLLGDKFNATDNMCYFNVYVDGIPFGSSSNKSTIYDTNNNFWDMQYRYFKNRYIADIIHFYYDKYFGGGKDDVNERFSELYKSKSPLLEKLYSVGVDLGYGRLESDIPGKRNLFKIYDIRGDFKFFAYGKNDYINNCRKKAETYVLNKSDIDRMFARIGEDILDEITETVEPVRGQTIADDMSDDASGMMCLYELEYAAAFAYCRYIFNDGSPENKFKLGNLCRDKYEEHNELATEALLEIVNLMYNSLTPDGKIAVGSKFNIRNSGNNWVLSGENCGFMEYEFNEIITSIEPIKVEKH